MSGKHNQNVEKWGAIMASLRTIFKVIALSCLTMLGGCGGGSDYFHWGVDVPPPTIDIQEPTLAIYYWTTASAVNVSGSVSGASFVHVVNTTTGSRIEAYVRYSSGHGSWFAAVTGLAPGANVIVATADADGSGARTANATLTITRPLQPASLILNGNGAATATSYWLDMLSFNASHRIALFADGTGRSTTGNLLTDQAGGPVTISWSYDGAEAILINGCPSCSFQRISRISGSTDEWRFWGQVETVGGGTDNATHAFQLNTGTF